MYKKYLIISNIVKKYKKLNNKNYLKILNLIDINDDEILDNLLGYVEYVDNTIYRINILNYCNSNINSILNGSNSKSIK
ncbi:unknown similar to AMEV229 [Choristoneura rosaceana entomopoxvirus 'L']|uniref:N1R/p28-like protein n=1 Tax=Choristoneura rosaceana entomopoxvirus 'L' TaxID=1293539 RepID=A0ABM9QKR4_9POXV|nr:unknown similar to AMEV229 [Choristoneura rosaceana entomopoxvirus 'L']CCU56133.1 unknown similar to AMEV229 [Choristoneura rosaceana entomopoxvirus 'L']